MTGLFSKLVTPLLLVSVFLVRDSECEGSIDPVPQKLKLFSKKDQGGESVSIDRIEMDLGQVGFDNKAVSVCFTGVWNFYDRVKFNPVEEEPGASEFVFAPQEFCLNLEDLGGAVSSVRFAGYQEDFQRNTVTLYQGTFFQGRQKVIKREVPNLGDLDKKVASIIVTGNGLWTVFEEQDYKGKSYCIFPAVSDNYAPAFYTDTADPEQQLKIPHNVIRSIKPSCEQKYITKLMIRKRNSSKTPNPKPFIRGSSAKKSKISNDGSKK